MSPLDPGLLVITVAALFQGIVAVRMACAPTREWGNSLSVFSIPGALPATLAVVLGLITVCSSAVMDGPEWPLAFRVFFGLGAIVFMICMFGTGSARVTRNHWMVIAFIMLIVMGVGCSEKGSRIPTVTVSLEPDKSDPTTRFALTELIDFIENETHGEMIVSIGQKSKGVTFRLRIDPDAFDAKEHYLIDIGRSGDATITGADPRGLLWGVRDFQHYYGREWLKGLGSGSTEPFSTESGPALDHRGLWSWWYGCSDPFAYIDRASEWKLNTVIFWNRGVPMNADRLNAYAETRGVDIWWGFSWGWVADDFKDASPALAEELMALYEKQKREISPDLQNLDLLDPATPPAFKKYVLDIFEKQYSWIPDIDGIYFQTATEMINPRLQSKSADLGEAVVASIKPIMEALHEKYPDLVIAAGIHNTGTEETYRALRNLPEYCTIIWEEGVTWAPSREIAAEQMTYRGQNERYGGIYRITMNCGMVFRDVMVRGEPFRNWLPRVERLWQYIENGQPEGSARGFKIFSDEGKEVGVPCSSDWRPMTNGTLLDNPNAAHLLTWSTDLVNGPPMEKDLFLIVEAGLIDLKMRRVPAMCAEIIWDPTRDRAELERLCSMIWNGEVGDWPETVNPYWHAGGAGTEPFSPTTTRNELGHTFSGMKIE